MSNNGGCKRRKVSFNFVFHEIFQKFDPFYTDVAIAFELKLYFFRRQAKLQDKNFVDYRKQEILHDIKPKTKAFNLKKFDDAFPKPNKKKEANMEFGELMHKYLTMRPDGRFATWHGKPQTKKTRKTKLDPNDGKTGLLQKMTSAAGVNKQAKDLPVTNRKATKNYTRAVKNAINQKADFEEDG